LETQDESMGRKMQVRSGTHHSAWGPLRSSST
jgi:hypothetical protein